MYTAIILDDEEKGRNAMRKFLSEYCPEIDIVGVTSSGEQALDRIESLRPQILFFDIEIAQASSEYNTSFDLLPKLPAYEYEVVFVTAYEHYAIQAIRSHAIGYVLKPISITDLNNAVDAAIEKLQVKGINERLVGLVDQLTYEKPHAQRIWIHSQKDIVPIYVKEIIRLEAQGKYTDIYHKDGTRITSSKNLGEFTDLFDKMKFVKIHRSHLVNTDRIMKYSKSDGGTVITMDGKELPVSKQGKERLFELL